MTSNNISSTVLERFSQQCTCILFVLALESRTLTRWDVHRYAREAYDMGVRYIGGCCGFEPYHIRAIAEEVRKEITRTGT